MVARPNLLSLKPPHPGPRPITPLSPPRRVRERRQTAWLAEPGIGALAYSGKLMPPSPFTPAVTSIRDALHARTGQRFDCVLCNQYPAGGEAACKWHTDPEHGSR